MQEVEPGILRLLPDHIILSGVIVRFDNKKYHALYAFASLQALQSSHSEFVKLKQKEPDLKNVDFNPVGEITGSGNSIADEITRLNIEAGFPISTSMKEL